MERAIRILIAEDNDDHFELVLRELKDQKMSFSHRHARTKAEFIEALSQFKPDLVISDYYLPDLDGMAAFRITRQQNPEIPFILVTGTLGEDMAVECMKAGISDYVMKEHMGRLGPSVRSAVHRMWAVSLLEETELQYRKLVEAVNGIVWRLDPATFRFKFVSPRAKDILGYPVEQWLDEKDFWKNHLHPEDRDWAYDFCVKATKEKSDHEFEYRMIAADGKVVWIHDIVSVIESAEGPIDLVGVMLDITPAKKAEETLRQNEERLAEIIENAPDPIIVLTALGFVQSMNPEAERVSGYLRDEIIGKHFSRTGLLSPGSLPNVTREFTAILAGEDRPPFELEFKRKDGKRLFFEAKARLLRKRGRAAGMQVIFRDLTERKRAEEALRASEEKFRTVTSHAPVGIALLDAKGGVLFMNEFLCALMGKTFEEMKGRGWIPAIHAEDRERVVRDWDAYCALENKAPKDFFSDCRILDTKNNIHMVSSHAVPLYDNAGGIAGYLATIVDVTERRLLEDQLRQSQKMEAVGRLAGGIAHDFNNILTAITGYTELALKSDTSESVHADLEEVYKAAERASGLTRQLLSFSRRQTVNARMLDPNELLRNMDKMLRRVIGEDVEFSIRTGSGLKPFKADPGQIEQVIMNLAVNARDALGTSGRITVETSFTHIDETFAVLHEGGKAGDYDLFAVCDTGQGMTEEVKKHLFEPFFTTKESGKGTGLGLATCYGIVKQAGGFIDVQSEPGKGTTVTVYLPVAEEAERSAAAAPESPARNLSGEKGAAKILLVDDESTVRNFAARILRQQGYIVLEASSGPEALKIAESEPARDLSLLFTDVMMPKMRGTELAEKLRVTRPGIKVLFASGFTEEPVVREGVQERKMPFIAKPFSADALVQKVREVLEPREALR